MKVTIIAEIGVNHNGNIRLAKKLIDIASKAGADFVKFQTFKAKNLATYFAKKANYQLKIKNKNETQLPMLKKLELNHFQHKILINYCKKKKIGFLSTAFDIESLNLLISLKLKKFKIPSGEITNLPLLKAIGKQKKDVIMSTGMANIKEIKNAIKILIKSGTKKNKITILHCNTDYPTHIEDVNLLAMKSIESKLKVNVGYSDHTLSREVPIAAVAMGAKVIEKHFTLSRKYPGPDHKSSLEPNELYSMVKEIRNTQKILGKREKKPSKSEIKNIKIVRKSIVAKTFIRKGEIFNISNITCKRPGTGISPMKWNFLIGKRAKKNFYPDELIKI